MVYADMVLTNGNIHTINDIHPKAEAVACKFGRILKVGKNEEIERLVGPDTRIIDLRGMAVLPGLSDNHLHPLLYGFFANGAKLFDVKSIDEMKIRISEQVRKTERGKMILGLGWNQELMKEKRYPTIHDLDPITPENPCFLIHYNFHVYFANSILMRQKGVTRDTPEPQGGRIVRDQNGDPSGVFEERAMDCLAPGFLESGAGLFSYEESKEALKITVRDAVKNGVVTIGDALADGVGIRAWQQLMKEGNLPVRVSIWVWYSLLDRLIDLGIESGLGMGDHVKIAGIKTIIDGSLSSHTAALREEYSDLAGSGNRGTLRLKEDDIDQIVAKAHKNNLRLHVHALGDRANDVALDAFEKALKERPSPDPRFQIAHSLVLSEDIIRRYRNLQIISQIQPCFLFKGQRWAPKLLGKDRLRYVHAWGKLVRAGIRCVAGTDAPIEEMNPINNIYACVVRKDLSGEYFDGEKMVSGGEGCYRPEERIGVHDAVKMLTIDSAYSTSEENVKGSIEEGKYADFVVLSADPYAVEPEIIKDIKVEMTIVGGNVVYTKN